MGITNGSAAYTQVEWKASHQSPHFPLRKFPFIHKLPHREHARRIAAANPPPFPILKEADSPLSPSCLCRTAISATHSCVHQPKRKQGNPTVDLQSWSRVALSCSKSCLPMVTSWRRKFIWHMQCRNAMSPLLTSKRTEPTKLVASYLCIPDELELTTRRTSPGQDPPFAFCSRLALTLAART